MTSRGLVGALVGVSILFVSFAITAIVMAGSTLNAVNRLQQNGEPRACTLRIVERLVVDANGGGMGTAIEPFRVNCRDLRRLERNP